MKVNEGILARGLDHEATEGSLSGMSKKQQIISYYEKAGPDYQEWSTNYNMHFGYYQQGMNPFDREAMLEKLNQLVYKKLGITPQSSLTLADFGCGLGATLRYGASHFQALKLKGITLVPWQVEQATALNAIENMFSQIEIIERDYCHTGFEANSIDAVIAIESSCYANGDNKSDLLSEIFRVLKPGGKFIIADGFLKKPVASDGFLGRVYHQLCSSWALTELGNIKAVEKQLHHLRFEAIKIDEVSLNIAPSVAHVPFTVVSFLLKEFFAGKEPMTKERWDNLKSPLLTMILGLARSHFGYYFVSGTKP